MSVDPIFERYIKIIREDNDDSTMSIEEDEIKVWRNKKGRISRSDGPAIIWPSGKKWWMKDGLTHRLDGPAVVYPDGSREYWIEGENFTEDEFYDYLVKNAINLGEEND